MTGSAPWSLEELQAIAVHHGETLVDLFSAQKSGDYERGVLIAGPLRASCRIWPGQMQAQHRAGDLIAIKGGTEWVVMVASDTPTPQACTVKRLIIEPKAERPRRFAILDDDVEIARRLAAGMVELGYDAIAFANETQLEAALLQEAFDGFLIDWGLAKDPAKAIVAKLRGHNPACPIALLTGQVAGDLEEERAMANAIRQHRLLFLQKPVTPLIAASQISAGLASG